MPTKHKYLNKKELEPIYFKNDYTEMELILLEKQDDNYQSLKYINKQLEVCNQEINPIYKNLLQTKIEISKNNDTIKIINHKMQFLKDKSEPTKELTFYLSDYKTIDVIFDKLSKYQIILSDNSLLLSPRFVEPYKEISLLISLRYLIISHNIFSMLYKIIYDKFMQHYINVFPQAIKPSLYKKHFSRQNRWNIEKIVQLSKPNVLEIIKQLEKDGLNHLMPVVASLKKSISDIRKDLGKGLWRRISNNSKTRNELIFYNFELNKANKNNTLEQKTIINILTTLPTTILRYIVVWNNPANLQYLNFIRSKVKHKKNIVKHYMPIYHLIEDTALMNNGDDNFLTKYGLRGINKLHDKLLTSTINLMYKKKVSSTALYENTYFLEKITINNIDLIPLVSEEDLFLEGERQKHCVFSYKDSVSLGENFIFHIIDRRDKHIIESTLMIDYKMRIIQHYGKRNKTVPRLPDNLSKVLIKKIQNKRIKI